jgi:2-keto-3-deoxy-6-phosphogluconate aldolase
MTRLVAYVPDLMDRSKIAAVVPDATFCRAPTELLAAAALHQGVELVVVDLSRAGVLEAIAELSHAGVATIGFGSHVDRAVLDAARLAGCERVLARSAFFRDLGELLGSP